MTILISADVAAGAWYVWSQQGWEVIGQGGINRQLLPEVGDVAPDLVALNGEREPRREGSAADPIINFPTHILNDRDGIVRDIVLAELNAEQFVERAQFILKPRDAP